MKRRGITLGIGQMESRVDLSGKGAACIPQLSPRHLSAYPNLGVCAKHGAFITTVQLGEAKSECARCKAGDSGLVSVGKASLSDALHNSGLTDRLIMASFSCFVAVTQEQRDAVDSTHEIAVQWAQGHMSDCGAVVLLGGHGTGKTHLAVAMARLLEGRRSVHFADVRLGTPVYPISTDVLVLDNVHCRGEVTPTTVRDDLNEIIRCRADRGQFTVLVSDADKEAFVRRFAPSTLSSLRRRNAMIVNLNWRVETHLIG